MTDEQLAEIEARARCSPGRCVVRTCDDVRALLAELKRLARYEALIQRLAESGVHDMNEWADCARDCAVCAAITLVEATP